MSAKKTALIIAQTTDPIDAVHRRAAPAARADQGGADDPVVEHHAGPCVQPAARRSVGRRPTCTSATRTRRTRIVDLQYGNSTAPVVSPVTVGPTSALKIPLPPTPINTNLIVNVRSDFPVVVPGGDRDAVPGRVPDRSGACDRAESCSLCGGAHPVGRVPGRQPFVRFARARAGRTRDARLPALPAGARVGEYQVTGAAGPGRDGRRLLGRPPAARAQGRDQGAEPAGSPIAEAAARFLQEARAAEPAAPPEHRRRVRVRADARRALLPGDGVPGGREPARDPAPGRAADAGAGARRDRRRAGRARRRAPARASSTATSSRTTSSCAPIATARGQRREDPRLRPGEERFAARTRRSRRARGSRWERRRTCRPSSAARCPTSTRARIVYAGGHRAVRDAGRARAVPVGIGVRRDDDADQRAGAAPQPRRRGAPSRWRA